jgi:hypothetical protein
MVLLSLEGALRSAPSKLRQAFVGYRHARILRPVFFVQPEISNSWG